MLVLREPRLRREPSQKEVIVNRTKATWFLIAFTVIGALTIVEGASDGFTSLNWVVIGVSAFFALQSILTLTRQ